MEVKMVKCHDMTFIYLPRGQYVSNIQSKVPTNWETEKSYLLQKYIHKLNIGNSHQLQYFKTSLDICYVINCPNNITYSAK